MSYKASLLAPDLLLVHALYSILVLDLRIVTLKGLGKRVASARSDASNGTSLSREFRY